MLPLWIEILGSFLIIIFGLFYLLRIIYSHKAGRKIWDIYSEITEKTSLEVKKSLNILSDWPNLHGEIDGKEIYVHPNRGKRRSPSKTIFAVETDIGLSEDIIITTSDTEVPEDSNDLDAQNLESYKYEVYSEGKYGDQFTEDLFSKKVSRDIHNLIKSNEENFRALILEDGLAMYSTFGIERDEKNISKNLKKLAEVVKGMDKNISEADEGVKSQRLIRMKEGTGSTAVKGIFPILLFGIAAYLFFQLINGFSFLFLNAAVLLAVIGSVKLYVLVYTMRKYQ